jgi:murein DD-endopeptidase MepM/ murein hydrolase activator NlpD
MFTNRDFEGRKSYPWQGGTYGFSRNPERIGGEILETKFHEGIDVSPVRRDASGEPLDDVRAIESGRVVHVSRAERDSNYGFYAVARHEVEGTPVYTIYAHLASVDVEPGQNVTKGARLGRLGYSGAGIDKRRAHLHLEIAVLWHDQFETWHAANFPTPNKHGIYNGINMMGLDVAELFLAQRKNPGLTLPQFVRGQKPFFRVQIPDSPHFQLPRRYPWLVDGGTRDARSWIVAFTAAGFPVSIKSSEESITAPRVVWAAPSAFSYEKVTRSLLSGRTGKPRLGESGQKLLSLLSWDPASAPQREAGS